MAYEYYPMEVFRQPEKILNEALRKAEQAPEKEFADRVRFLQTGLTHGKMCVEFSAFHAANDFEHALEKLNEIIAFRKKHEGEFFAELVELKDSETRGYQNLRSLIQGKFIYQSDPPLHGNRFKRESVEELSGLRAVYSSLILPEKHRQGHVLFKYDAGKNNSFIDAVLSVTAWANKITNTLEISFDGKEYRKIKDNVTIEKIDLTSLVRGKNLFYLRFTAFRRPDFPGNQMALYQNRLDYSKKFPDVKKERKLDIGTGWLDFNPVWFFRKDGKNAGIPMENMRPGRFSFDGWTRISVPDFLDNTPIGTYIGYGWYAAEFSIPKDWAARSADFLFEAVDEQAWVYVNGKKVGEHSCESEKLLPDALWKEPFIVKVPAELLNPGGKNLICVRFHSSAGASGIWKPVRIRPVDASAQNE